MSQNSEGGFFTATIMAVATFLLAFGCLWTLGDFAFFPAVFFAALIAAIVWLILFIGIGGPGSLISPATQKSESASPSSASASTAASAATAATAGATPVRDPSEEAAEAKRLADEQAAARAAADEERRKAEEAELAEAKRKADAEAADAAAAEAKQKADDKAAAEAKRKADDAAAADAKRREDEAAAAQKASDEAAAREAAPAMTDNPAAATTPDYDGDGVREGTDEGTRPAGLDGPRDGKADDLKQIKGIGAKMEALCNRLGFWHFDQIAAWSADEVAWVDANLEGFKGRVTRDTWVEQAALLAAGGETEFSKRVEDGDVY